MTTSSSVGPAIEVRGLGFRHPRGDALALDGIDLDIARGSRCLLVGANGAGKSTLLRILAGRHMVPLGAVTVLGRAAFHDASLGGRVELIGPHFPFQVDLTVDEILGHHQDADPDRVATLIQLLAIDRRWHMHSVSDGQRRRVQLLLGLMTPHEVLLLDEATTDLDLLARANLLAFLRRETEGRGATLVYATHILDSLDEWATHLIYLVAGKVGVAARFEDIPELAARQGGGLYRLIEAWLRRDAATARG